MDNPPNKILVFPGIQGCSDVPNVSNKMPDVLAEYLALVLLLQSSSNGALPLAFFILSLRLLFSVRAVCGCYFQQHSALSFFSCEILSLLTAIFYHIAHWPIAT